MKYGKNPAFAAVVVLMALGSLPLSCVSRDKSGQNDVRKQPYRDASLYAFDPKSPLSERIRPAPPILLDALREMDGRDDYAQHQLKDSERALIEEYLSYLPASFLRVMEERLCGIFFIDGFLGGGMSDFVFTEKDDMRIILILNPATLETPLSEWIRERDESSFKPEPGFAIENGLGSEYKGLLQTLTHESAHIYDYFRHATPYTEPHLAGRMPPSAKSAPFTALVWKSYDTPIKAYDFPERRKLSFYGFGDPLDSSTAVSAYSSLGKTPFASLYGSATWAEDFAESFTWHFLHERLSLDYSVTVMLDGEKILAFSPLENEAGRDRYALLKESIGN